MGNLVYSTRNSEPRWGFHVTVLNQTPCGLNISGLFYPLCTTGPARPIGSSSTGTSYPRLDTQRTTIHSTMEQICRYLNGFPTDRGLEMN